MSLERLRTAWAVLFLMTGLGSCVHLLPAIKMPPAPAVAPASPVCPGGLLADLEPAPALPAAAGFPAPTTDAEGAAVKSYGTWLHDYAAWAKRGWQRAGDAKAFCSTPH